MIRTFLSLAFLALPFTAFSQTSDGRVGSLVAAENYFSALSQSEGIKKAFLKVSDENTIIFRPDPVNALKYYNDSGEDPGNLIWEPVTARISRSGDWGYTLGPYTYTDAKSNQTSHGFYLSVWTSNRKGVWKLAVDLGTPQPKSTREYPLSYTNPESFRFFRQLSHARLKQREDIVATTDKLLSTTLRKNTQLAYDTFLDAGAQLLFPGHEPLNGKKAILSFYDKNKISITTEFIDANRALGSDLAFSYGNAQVSRGNEMFPCNYIRIWESKNGQWNIITEIFSPRQAANP